MKFLNIIPIFSLLLFFCSCTQTQNPKAINENPLPSWQDGTVKKSIMGFVIDVTDPESGNFIAIPDRIAVFDNDGNLWSEQPVYFQVFFTMDRIKELAPEHPEWDSIQPYKSVLEGDFETLLTLGEHGILEILMTTHADNTVDEFELIVKNWIANARHPSLDRPYTDLVYQPMLELIAYLQSNDFKTFIVSGGGIAFMRPWVENVYGIPRDQVVGSIIKTELVMEDGIPVIRRLPEMEFIDDKEGKPIGINKFIGRKPIFCSGNSDGDLAMMQWTASGAGERFMLYVHHTDSIREWAYDRKSHIGRLDKGLDEAEANNWTVIDMKDDWKVIYPFELEGKQ